MPEGDTIFRAARALHKALAGGVVVGFETALAKLARQEDDATLVGRTVERVEPRGKWCLMYFSRGRSGEEAAILATHMLMSGSWHIYRAGERWRMPRRAMRAVVRVQGSVAGGLGREEGSQRASVGDIVGKGGGLSGVTAREGGGGHPTSGAEAARLTWGTQRGAGWEAVLFNAQVAEFFTAHSLERSGQIPKLGPDILSAEFTVAGGVDRLRAYAAANPEAEVGVVLLNQRVMAGLGNVYKSEVAFAAAVNPWRTMRTVSDAEMETMVEFALRYMKANVVDGAGDGIVTYSGNRRTTGRMDREERLWVYGRQGQECRRCGAAVMMRKQGTQARSTYWCPGCQPWQGQGVAPMGDAVARRRGKVGC